MNPEIFPGIDATESPLYKKLQLYIAQNGGRHKLADALEAEMVKQSRFAAPKQPKVIHHKKYNAKEMHILLSNYGKISARKIAKNLGRSNGSIYHKIAMLRIAGTITDKPFYHWS